MPSSERARRRQSRELIYSKNKLIIGFIFSVTLDRERTLTIVVTFFDASTISVPKGLACRDTHNVRVDLVGLFSSSSFRRRCPISPFMGTKREGKGPLLWKPTLVTRRRRKRARRSRFVFACLHDSSSPEELLAAVGFLVDGGLPLSLKP